MLSYKLIHQEYRFDKQHQFLEVTRQVYKDMYYELEEPLRHLDKNLLFLSWVGGSDESKWHFSVFNYVPENWLWQRVFFYNMENRIINGCELSNNLLSLQLLMALLQQRQLTQFLCQRNTWPEFWWVISEYETDVKFIRFQEFIILIHSRFPKLWWLARHR